MSIETLIAQQLAEKGKRIEPKHNTIYSAVDEYGESSELVGAAIDGFSNMIKADINMFRNVILTASKELEQLIRDKAKTAPVSASDKVNIVTTHYQDGVDILEQLGIVSGYTDSSYSDLPNLPLVIEYEKHTVTSNFNLGNNRIRNHVDELLAVREDDYLEKLHDKLFSNVSSNNQFIRDIKFDPVSDYAELMLGLIMTLGYIEGTLGVSNKQPKDARVNYLYTLRDILASGLGMYKSNYTRYLNNDILIAKLKTDEASGVSTLTLVGEVYNKYLDDHNVDPLIGFSVREKNANGVKLETIIKDIHSLTEYYEATMRVAYMRSAMNNINALRTAYEVATREFLMNMPESRMDLVTGDNSDYSLAKALDLVSAYVSSKSDDEITEVTEISRYIVSQIVFSRPEFLKFAEYMGYYTKVFPKLEVDEVATCAMVAYTMDVLEKQVNIVTVYKR